MTYRSERLPFIHETTGCEFKRFAWSSGAHSSSLSTYKERKQKYTTPRMSILRNILQRPTLTLAFILNTLHCKHGLPETTIWDSAWCGIDLDRNTATNNNQKPSQTPRLRNHQCILDFSHRLLLYRLFVVVDIVGARFYGQFSASQEKFDNVILSSNTIPLSKLFGFNCNQYLWFLRVGSTLITIGFSIRAELFRFNLLGALCWDLACGSPKCSLVSYSLEFRKALDKPARMLLLYNGHSCTSHTHRSCHARRAVHGIVDDRVRRATGPLMQ